MKFVAISDTHGKHDQLTLPPGDLLIHSGDISMKGGETAAITLYEVRPKVHIFGHIHPSHGVSERPGIRYINAAVVNDRYEVVNTPVTSNCSHTHTLFETLKNKSHRS